MENYTFAIIAVLFLGFGFISRRLQKTILTPPLFFVIAGLIIGPTLFGWIAFDIDRSFIHIFATLTLVLVLFTDASRIDLKLLYREHNIPIRLLLIGLPISILVGGVTATYIFPTLLLWEAMILAAILAPTDAALGQNVVVNPLVPVRIRQTINVESGLNDGLVLPFILIFLSLAGAEGYSTDKEYWIRFISSQLILGPVVGMAVGYFGGKGLEKARKQKWISHAFESLASLGLSLISYSVAEIIGGNGFISAFVAGLTLGNCARNICPCLYDFGEAEGQLLALLTFLIFGIVMVPGIIAHITWHTVVYALLCLTLIRMIPTTLSLIGLKLKWPSILFLGWFGPRGLASIIFGLLIVEQSNLAHQEEIFVTIILTVLMSVVAHGITAYPASLAYARWSEKKKKVKGISEHKEVAEMPVRIKQQ